ncbi:fatty acid desaturase, type 1 protein [Tanacetum coccineum]
MAASDDMKLFERVPISNPPFGYDDLKRAIPPHCFAKSLKRSLYLLSNEIFLTCTFYYVASNYIDFLPKVLSYIAWPLYWIVQGLALGRLWSIGHDCSHHSFCGYGWLDDTIGIDNLQAKSKSNLKLYTMAASDDMKLFERVPISNPPFGYDDLKRAIPPHCFVKSLKRSLYLLSNEIFLTCTFYYVASNYIDFLPKVLSYIAWPLYWIVQGLALGRLWSIGHDCSHHSFCGYGWLDDTIGYLIHSFVLTPYFSFKFTHHNHHAHTNHLEYDENHIPKRKSDQLYYEIIDNPIGFVFMISFKLMFGFPLYLLINYGGRKCEGLASHYYPQSVLFRNSQRAKVFLSDVGVLVFIYAYYRIVMTQGAIWLFNLFGGPWVFMCGILLVLSYLQHNHPSIPHFDSLEWSWIRGALSTVDRDVV